MMKPTYSSRWSTLTGVLLPIFLYMLLSSVTAAAAEKMGPAAYAADPFMRTLPAALAALLALTPLAVSYRRLRQSEGEGIGGTGDSPGERTDRHGFYRSLLFFLLSFAAGAVFSAGSSMLMEAVHLDRHLNNDVQEQLLQASPALRVIGLGLLVPAAEETLYRGLVYTRLRAVLRAAPALVVTSLLFALGHGSPVQILYAFPGAMLMGWFREKSDSLIPAVLFHMGANLAAVMLSFLQQAA